MSSPEQQQESLAQEASVDSLWGELGGLNLAGLDDWEEPQYVDVERIIEQLVQCPRDDPTTLAPLLQQLANPDTPSYAILGAQQWPQLVQLLPQLLLQAPPASVLLPGSGSKSGSELPQQQDNDVLVLSEQLLQQQLAPELLHCSPDPLAELITALLITGTTAQQQQQQQPASSPAASQPERLHHLQGSALQDQAAAAAAAAQQSPPPTAVAAAAAARPMAGAAVMVYPTSVLCFIISGLQKLGRQWHFLEAAAAEALAAAVVGLMLQAISTALRGPAAAAVAAEGVAGGGEEGAAGEVARSVGLHAHCIQQQRHQQQQRQQQQQQEQQGCSVPLVVSLLLFDPMLCWWQRLNASSNSSRAIKAAAAHQGLVSTLMHWARQQQQQQQRQNQQQLHKPCSGSSLCASCAAVGLLPGAGNTTTSSSASCSGRVSPVGESGVLADCVAVHCLAAWVGTHSGRQLLVRQQHQQQQHPGSPSLQHSSDDSLSIAVSCLQGWAHLRHQVSNPPADNAISAPPPAQAQGSSSSSSSSTLHGAQQQQQPQQSPSCPSQGSAVAEDTMAEEPSAQGGSALSAHPFPPWGPVRPAGLPPFVAKQAAQGTAAAAAVEMGDKGPFGGDGGVGGTDGMREPGGGGGSGGDALSEVSATLVVEAAASTAAWALKAYQEQQRWFPA